MFSSECDFCGQDYARNLVTCLDENKQLCNGKCETDEYSHAIEHAKETKHTLRIFTDTNQFQCLNIQCNKCGINELCKLGFKAVGDATKNTAQGRKYVFICKVCQERNEDKNVGQFIPVVTTEGFLHSSIANVVNLGKGIHFQSQEQFVKTWNEFLDREEKAELYQSSKLKTIKNVTVKWKSNVDGVVSAKIHTKLNESDTIGLEHGTWKGTARVISSNSKGEITVKLCPMELKKNESGNEASHPNESNGYSMKYRHICKEKLNPIFFKRTREALKLFENRSKDDILVKLFIGGLKKDNKQ